MWKKYLFLHFSFIFLFIHLYTRTVKGPVPKRIKQGIFLITLHQEEQRFKWKCCKCIQNLFLIFVYSYIKITQTFKALQTFWLKNSIFLWVFLFNKKKTFIRLSRNFRKNVATCIKTIILKFKKNAFHIQRNINVWNK